MGLPAHRQPPRPHPDASHPRHRSQIEIRRGEHYERFNDPLNPKLSHSPMGSSSICFGVGYQTPDWVVPDPESRPGELKDLLVRSRALGRDVRVSVYVPARFRPSASYPLLVVHDGADFLQYASMKTVLDNLIHRMDVAGLVAAFVNPDDRLVEYANSAAHSRFLTGELLPELETSLPLVGTRAGRCLMGSSFGAVATLAAQFFVDWMFGYQSFSSTTGDVWMDDLALSKVGRSQPKQIIRHSGSPRICGTRNRPSSAAGAPASASSAVRHGCSSSTRNTLVSGTACDVGSMSAAATSCTRATAPRMTDNWPARWSSSSSVIAMRASRASS